MWKMFVNEIPQDDVSIAIRDTINKLYYFGRVENGIFRSYCNYYQYSIKELINNYEITWMYRKEFVEFVETLSKNGKTI